MTSVVMASSVAAALLINAAPGFAGTVNVSFIHPENFTDASLQGGYGTRAEQVGRFFESLGPRYLKSGQVLTLDVLNIDPAGRIEWWRRGFYETRVLRDVYTPRFTLSKDGRTLVENKETVVDPNYLANPGIYFSPNDRLRFEKAMLKEWFRRRFGDQRTATSF
jgi:hypothetical protein